MTANRPSERGIDSLDQRHLMSIILFLHENGPSGKMEIYEAVSKNANMPRRLESLVDMNLLELENSRFHLTDVGRNVATRLSDIEGMLTSSTNN